MTALVGCDGCLLVGRGAACPVGQGQSEMATVGAGFKPARRANRPPVLGPGVGAREHGLAGARVL